MPVSQITGEPIDIKAGPNWDDDLSGSPIYAENDLNLDKLTEEERAQLFEIERLTMFYLPRICNHCANPSCVAACPSGAIYKRGEDGIVLINQEKCRGWRACVAACPYKKIYYNWKTGKSEKCILCFPRLETGQAPACFHSCVGRIRYLGVMLYDADRIPGAMKVSDRALVESQRTAFLDPSNDPRLLLPPARTASARSSSMPPRNPRPGNTSWNGSSPCRCTLNTAPCRCCSTSRRFCRSWASPSTARMSTAPTSFSRAWNNPACRSSTSPASSAPATKTSFEAVMKKLMAVRYYKRWQSVRDLPENDVQKILREAKTTPEEVEEIYQMTAHAHPVRALRPAAPASVRKPSSPPAAPKPARAAPASASTPPLPPAHDNDSPRYLR